MRHGRVVLLSAVLLTGVTGCADRPNDLETYYDKPGNSSGAVTSAPVPPVNHDPAAAAGNSSRSAVADAVSEAVVTKSDLASEGVRAATQRAENGRCFNAVPAGDPRGASWTYTSGSTLTQQVTGYLDQNATDVLAAVSCEGQKLQIPTPSQAEALRAWCSAGTCTVLMASGHVLSGLQVTASTSARAQDAVKSVTPLAASKLPKQP